MGEMVVFPLFGEGGFLNPTPWPSGVAPQVWDFDAGRWRSKQTREYDGGWRWFPKFDADATVIYNVKLHKQAHYVLTKQEIVDSHLQPELLLMCARSHVMIDHNFFTSRDWLHDKIRADFLKLRRELFGDRIRED